MRSAQRGKSTSAVELTNVSGTGFWLLLDGQEHFLPFKEFPWFEHVTIGQLANVERPRSDHLYWPDLDVDLAVDSIEHPERYPLVSLVRPNYGMQPSAGATARCAKRRPAPRALRG